MKKIFGLIVLSTIMISTFSIQMAYGYYPVDKHYFCLSNRWKYFAQDSNEGYYYDSESIVKENKFLPFQDRIIKLWVAEHHRSYGTCYTYKYQYEINLDKNTYKILNSKNPTHKPIVPDSKYEQIYNISKDLYEDNPILNTVTNKVNEIGETIERANKIAKERSNTK